MARAAAGGYHFPMKLYRAEHFRRRNLRESIADGIGNREFKAKDDAAAFDRAMALFRDDYNRRTDRIHISELLQGEEPRHVWLTGDS
ncbi:MAG TPA: hypothetical protein VII73_12500 [Caulobacteraceae bacterium]